MLRREWRSNQFLHCLSVSAMLMWHSLLRYSVLFNPLQADIQFSDDRPALSYSLLPANCWSTRTTSHFWRWIMNVEGWVFSFRVEGLTTGLRYCTEARSVPDQHHQMKDTSRDPPREKMNCFRLFGNVISNSVWWPPDEDGSCNSWLVEVVVTSMKSRLV